MTGLAAEPGRRRVRRTCTLRRRAGLIGLLGRANSSTVRAMAAGILVNKTA